MARANDSNYLQHLVGVMRGEFDRIGITVTNFKIDHQADVYTTSRTPIELANRGVKLSVEFICDEDQYMHMQSLCHHSRREHIKKPIMPPVTLFGQQTLEDLAQLKYETETLHHCVMSLNATGGRIDSFVEQFRSRTNEIFLKIESLAFDEEVTKLLTTNEYNN